MSSSYRDLFVSASDGLRLYARDYGPLNGSALPVVCLPGLARNSEDFHDLAKALSTDTARPRRVLALDYRGRGRSEWASDWRQYEIGTELNDLLQVLTVAGIEKAVFVGTSRGGLLTMALSATRPTLLAGAVLNDVGPVIEPKGLIRIRSYVGKLPTPNTMQEGAQILKHVSDTQFPAFTQEQWESMARGTWHEKNDRLAFSYDPSLMKPLQALDLEMPMPDLWSLFGGLNPFPVLAIRGENSDLLSARTLSAMQERHPRLTAITVPGQGHAPLIEEPIIQSIKDLIAHAETSL
ncbi:alpha/beta hydrolase [Microvirga sp. KLBC 81]|uniref:alpha/beta fold hydrolase n=1 Tax=Microvirga sp. KLBC 81 TaxID=1862707 RepID=UPI000D51717A|nr:alpha/beta hydrolase [Microvirga sp. KLBC 81]PVE24390.1 alpha/beta hydrolase [Microvirga sp. KLBC 81]